MKQWQVFRSLCSTAVILLPDCRLQVPFHNLKPIILAAQEQLNFRVP